MSSWNLCDKKLTLNNCFNAAKPSFKSLQCTAGGQRLAVDVCAVWPAAALKHGHIEAKTEDGVRADHMEAVLVFYCINQGWSLHQNQINQSEFIACGSSMVCSEVNITWLHSFCPNMIKTNTWARLLQVGRQNGYIYSAEHDGWSVITMLVLISQHHN